MVLRWWKERKILFKDYGNTIPFIYFGQLNAVYIALASYADISSGMDCTDCGFTLSRVTQEYDFSINNAPLIIAPLLKGEWQSFPSSRGEGGLCVSGKAWFTFWKVHLSPGGFAYHFLSIKTLNFLCCGKLSNPVHACSIWAASCFHLICFASIYRKKCAWNIYTYVDIHTPRFLKFMDICSSQILSQRLNCSKDFLILQHICWVASAR